MKKIILICGLICGYIIPAFSQLNSNFKIDTTFRKLSVFNNQKSFNMGITNDYKYLHMKKYNFKQSTPPILTFNQDTIGNMEKIQSGAKMPCLNPQGFFPMVVYKPDSSVRYAMRIEDIK